MCIMDPKHYSILLPEIIIVNKKCVKLNVYITWIRELKSPYVSYTRKQQKNKKKYFNPHRDFFNKETKIGNVIHHLMCPVFMFISCYFNSTNESSNVCNIITSQLRLNWLWDSWFRALVSICHFCNLYLKFSFLSHQSYHITFLVSLFCPFSPHGHITFW